MSDTKISEAVERLERAYIVGMDEEFRDDLRVVLDALSQPAELAQSPAGHELAYAVEKALGNRDGKRDAELDELLEMAMNELNAIDTNLPAELAEQQGDVAAWLLINKAGNAIGATLHDRERESWEAVAGTTEPLYATPRAQAADGFQTAFYELADMLGMTAQPISPKEAWETQMRPALQAAIAARGPVPMVLHCPRCHVQHVDAPDERTPGWENPPHRSHLCHDCGLIWRPADVPTIGVEQTQTTGKSDTPFDPTTLAATGKQQVGEVQGGALLESLVARWRRDADEVGNSDNTLCQKIANCTMRHAAELQAVIAARQPGTPNGKLVGWWNGITPGYDGQGDWSIRWGADAENSRHDIPLYDGFNPIHYQQPALGIDLGSIPDGWSLRTLETCYQLSDGNQVVANLVGPDAERNAQILATLIDQRDAAPGVGQ